MCLSVEETRSGSKNLVGPLRCSRLAFGEGLMIRLIERMAKRRLMNCLSLKSGMEE